MKFKKWRSGLLDIVIMAGAAVNLVVIAFLLVYYFSTH
jgi:hypothetical protein